MALNSVEFANFMITLDLGKIVGKSAFSALFSFLKFQKISIIKDAVSLLVVIAERFTGATIAGM